jgi:carbon-monoxide dehydrogenase small subunit
VQVDGAEITTVEGLGHVDALSPLQQAFGEHHALQCGFCTPGMLMTVVDMMEKKIPATPADVREALSGNLCRCTGYEFIIDAVLAVLAADGDGRDD